MTRITKRERLRRTARSGDVDSMFELAEAYDFDRPKDRRRAVHWYRKAASLGHSEAQNSLAECLRDGVGGSADPEEAVHWFKEAAEQGNSDAQVSLGYALYYGQGCRKNRKKALHWYRQADASDNPSASLNIGHMYREGSGITQNWKKAVACYERAAALEDAAAYHWLARIHGGHENYPENPTEALKWLSLAAEEGDPWSQCELGVHYIRGDGVDVDDERGASLYRSAAEQGDNWASYLLGLCYRDGLGVKRNRRWAEYWLRKAASDDVEEAIDALREVRSGA